MGILERYFDMAILGVGSFYWTICLFLVFLKVPQSENFIPYRKAKKLLAITYFIMGINLFAWLVFSDNEWKTFNETVLCIDIILYFLAAIFFGYSFYYLLDIHFLKRSRVIFDFSVWGVTTLLMLLTLRKDFASIKAWLVGISLLFMFSIFGIFLCNFRALYMRAKEQLDDYFSEDMQKFIIWTKKSLVFLTLSVILTLLSTTLGVYYNFAYQFYVVTVNFYIAISFLNFSRQYGILSKSNVTIPETVVATEGQNTAESTSNFEKQFGKAIVQWLEDKKYLTPQITIEDLASEIGTNKLYVSRYINKKYAINFSLWITKLRIDEAKNYMRTYPASRQEEVACHSGFSSSSYFSKVFSRMEGISPAVWRREACGA